MKKWGFLVTALYALILVVVVLPIANWAIGDHTSFAAMLREWGVWVWVTVMVAGEATLLVVPVDTSFRKITRRSPVVVSLVGAALSTALLTWFSVGALLAAAQKTTAGDDRLILIGFWLVWSVVFYAHSRGSSQSIANVTDWLLKGSILELLVVVPCHIIVRRRGDCSAPITTGFGIATGIAIMLMSFGPSVLFLYRKRLQEYRAVHGARGALHHA